ncbi:hypothetical protein L6452_22076 [Arctium lappa]|uniref:Uncharacterized protein n=1 Tax=Arctium lappa TaxID=4217 RepID=A0ACB9AZ52_ARCLA|nr:hypothetical protein L6452_22076 [Arctium lappa]
MKDLTMEDTVNNNSQGKSKDRQTIELMKESVIEIGSSSTRCTRSVTRSKEVKEETQWNHEQMKKRILSCGKSKDKYEGSSAQGSQAGKKVKGEETDEMEKKRKTNTNDSTDSLRNRPKFGNLRTSTSPRTLKETIVAWRTGFDQSEKK